MHGDKTSAAAATAAAANKDAPRGSRTATMAKLALAIVSQGVITAAVMMVMKEQLCVNISAMRVSWHDSVPNPTKPCVCDLGMISAHPAPVASEIWAWGWDNNRDFGMDFVEDRPMPTEVTTMHGRHIHAVAYGYCHVMAVVDDGELWATGWNVDGQLGLGDHENRSSFTRVSGLSGRKVVAVAGGKAHSLALLETGELFTWGLNDHGQLGLGDNNDRSMPVLVDALRGKRVVAIACGAIHSVALLNTGELFAWGRDCHDQLGIDDNADRNVPTQVMALAGRRVVAVACGQSHIAAVLESGELFTWGWNYRGQLGHGDCTLSKNTPQLVETLRGRPVAAVACGDFHTLTLLKTGEVFAWGRNEQGQLGLGEINRKPVIIPQQIHFFDDKRVRSIHGGMFFSGAVLESGELFLWGDKLGQFGIGDKRDGATPTPVAELTTKRVLSVALGDDHMLALVE